MPEGADWSTVPALVALMTVITDGRATTLVTLAASAIVSLPTGATLQAGLEAAAKAVHLEAVREEVLLAARAPDSLLWIDIVRHCLLVSVYPMASLL